MIFNDIALVLITKENQRLLLSTATDSRSETLLDAFSGSPQTLLQNSSRGTEIWHVDYSCLVSTKQILMF